MNIIEDQGPEDPQMETQESHEGSTYTHSEDPKVETPQSTYMQKFRNKMAENPPLDDSNSMQNHIKRMAEKFGRPKKSDGSIDLEKENYQRNYAIESDKAWMELNKREEELRNLKLSSDTEVSTENNNVSAEVKNNEVLKPVKESKLPLLIQVIKDEADGLLRKGMYGDAIQEYTKAIDELPSYSSYDVTMNKSEAALHNNRALCHLKNGDDTNCIKDCKRALELKPFDVKARMPLLF